MTRVTTICQGGPNCYDYLDIRLWGFPRSQGAVAAGILERFCRRRGWVLEAQEGIHCECGIYKKSKVPHGLKMKVWERDGFRCRTCAAQRSLSVDHIIPEAQGGRTELDNLQTLCRSCNSRKGAAVPASSATARDERPVSGAPGLGRTAQAVYQYLLRLAQAHGMSACHPNVRTIARALGIPARTVEYNLQRLEAAQKIRREHSPGSATRYHLPQLSPETGTGP